MFAQTTALLFLVAKTLRYREPLQGFAKFPFVGGNNAGQTRSQLGSHRDFAFAFVGEIEELCDNFGTAFLPVEIGRLENGTVPFGEAVAAADFTPASEDGVSKGAILGKKVSETRKWLHQLMMVLSGPRFN